MSCFFSLEHEKIIIIRSLVKKRTIIKYGDLMTKERDIPVLLQTVLWSRNFLFPLWRSDFQKVPEPEPAPTLALTYLL
jgi:hypothetical protein